MGYVKWKRNKFQIPFFVWMLLWDDFISHRIKKGLQDFRFKFKLKLLSKIERSNHKTIGVESRYPDNLTSYSDNWVEELSVGLVAWVTVGRWQECIDWCS